MNYSNNNYLEFFIELAIIVNRYINKYPLLCVIKLDNFIVYILNVTFCKQDINNKLYQITSIFQILETNKNLFSKNKKTVHIWFRVEGVGGGGVRGEG